MKFKQLLIDLSNLEEEAFTSSLVAYRLKKPVREISNDLRRTHQMGFLRRKRVKHLCLSKNGQLCYKGYEYIYSLSKQGRSHLKWMIEQKPIEDLALIKLAKEILDHLPRELKYKLFNYVAIRNSHKYKGPNRQLRMIDKIVPIAFLLLENQRLAKEYFNLVMEYLKKFKENDGYRDQISDLNQVNEAFIGIIVDLKQMIEQTEQQNREDVKSVLNFLRKIFEDMQRKQVIDKEMMNINNEIIEVYRNSRGNMISALYLALPEEEFNKAMEWVSEREKKLRTDVEQKIEAVKAEINYLGYQSKASVHARHLP